MARKAGEGCDGGEEFAGSEEAGVGAFEEGDAGVVAELLGDLAVAGVDGEDGWCAVLQHAVGEAAGGGSDVDAGEAGEEMDQWARACSSLRPPRLTYLRSEPRRRMAAVGGDGGAGLVDALLVDEDAAGEDEGLGALAGGGVALVDEELVETDLLGRWRFLVGLVIVCICRSW